MLGLEEVDALERQLRAAIVALNKKGTVIEPTAVDDGMLHGLLTLKGEFIQIGAKLATHPRLCAEVVIPMRDGDSVLRVLEMAIAVGDFDDECETFEEGDRIRIAYDSVCARYEELGVRGKSLRL